VPSLFRRKADDVTADTAADDGAVATVTTTTSRGYTPSKRELGQATPKRKAGGRAVEAPPANRKEAVKRLREKQRQTRMEAREGMMAGKDEFLPVRDKGPERALVRRVVDARRNLASYFLPVAMVTIIGASGRMPAIVQAATNLLWMMVAVAAVIDSVLLTRKIKKRLLEQFPKAKLPPRRHYFYAIVRSAQFRRMRMPKPAVKLGEKV
jgi:hypothetical protein